MPDGWEKRWASWVGRWLIGLLILSLAACSGSNPPRKRYFPPIHGQFYRVRPGDTLYSIARRSGHHYRDLARWNRIRPPYIIHVGQLLRLKPRSRVKAAAKAKTGKAPSRHPKKIAKKNLKISFRWPLRGVIVRNFIQTGRKGIDIAAAPGTPVRAAASGKVVYSGDGLVGYGNLVIIKHGETYLSAYGNNRRLRVREGQRVKSGQTIAEVGRGNDGRAVLHFEIRRNGDPVDPLRYLPKR